jgi:hypothetical protein
MVSGENLREQVAHGLVATADVEQVEPAFGTVVCDGVGEFFVLLGGNREELVQCVDVLLDELVHANPVNSVACAEGGSCGVEVSSFEAIDAMTVVSNGMSSRPNIAM